MYWWDRVNFPRLIIPEELLQGLLIRGPEFSPDGKYFAFWEEIKNSSLKLWVLNTENFDIKRWAIKDAYFPPLPCYWFSDSKSIIFKGKDERSLKRINILTGKIEEVFRLP